MNKIFALRFVNAVLSRLAILAPMIWIYTEGEGDMIRSRQPSKIFFGWKLQKCNFAILFSSVVDYWVMHRSLLRIFFCFTNYGRYVFFLKNPQATPEKEFFQYLNFRLVLQTKKQLIKKALNYFHIYQNYFKSQQKSSTVLENKVCT